MTDFLLGLVLGFMLGAFGLLQVVFEEISPKQYFEFREEARIARAKALLAEYDA